jgi:outer membrane lipoprotein SlyB
LGLQLQISAATKLETSLGRISCCSFFISGAFMRTFFSVALSVVLVLTLSACASSSPDVVQRGDAQRLSQVQDAVVLSVRNVVVDGSQSGIGAAVGGVTGAVAGSTRGGSNAESNVIGLLVGVAGAVAGNAVERMATREEAVEILVQLKNGDRRAIVQSKGAEVLVPGDSVILVTTGGKVRIVKAPR